jgi:2-dehydro-3-deoxyphosphogluconate aldolase/(4S)-4-hydroxy-2-oxoglutarate aldolase
MTDPFTGPLDPLAWLDTHRLVPVVVLRDPEDADPMADALVSGGLPVAEVTFRTPAAPEAIRRLAARGDILVGAGTVLTAGQVDQAARAGARFVVSPGLSPAVVGRCQELDLPVLAGAVTATEIQAALEFGLSTVKFFPAGTSGGPQAVVALAAPFPGLRFVPTGGIDQSNLAGYLAVPAVRAVGGSWMVPQRALASRDTEQIRQLTRQAVDHVRATPRGRTTP